MHAPFRRIVPGAQDAVLFIHGIVSTPRFFDDFVAVVPQEWSVHSLLLPGHGGTVRDFGRSSLREWRAHVRAALDELRASHERVYIVAHSLGTLLSIREAVRDDTRIAGMLLLCVPLRIFPKPSALIHNTLKGIGLAENTAELHTYYGTEQDWRVWRYIGWIPRYLELFRESAAARREVHRLRVPSRVYMAARDELVSLRGERDMSANTAIDLARLPDSHHHEFAPADKAALLDALRAMCDPGKMQEKTINGGSMRLLFAIDKQDYAACTYTFVRNSARSIILRGGKVALIHSLKQNYYKFPGGGIEAGEDPITAMIRETREEAGLIVRPETVREYGFVHRIQRGVKDENECFIQDNFYYFCDVEDEILPPQMEDYEEEAGFTLEFVDARCAIRTNRESALDNRYHTMLHREARVLELLLEEGIVT